MTIDKIIDEATKCQENLGLDYGKLIYKTTYCTLSFCYNKCKYLKKSETMMEKGFKLPRCMIREMVIVE